MNFDVAEKTPPKTMFSISPEGNWSPDGKDDAMATLLEKAPVISEKPWIHVRAMLAAKVWVGQALFSITWNAAAMNGRQYLA